ncbi:adaptin N terminal region-domain-containing protein [Mucor mucedo]|uniref:adaptin N terminal region-domain-containing protein n=1 Tax=Mucor mucedo TaxID=29922 RepID=UPI00221F4063|nr:adaptin N terminal region-domain-containing protein [Mucor mucedo]KAI7890592.1 adaptin N terminal region-domain-containing protein [Mucor mucedo]
MFEKSLTDLIRGIRANKKNEQKYIAVCLQEIRNEVKSNDLDIKATAVAKLTYLQMLGYDMSWASFHMVEVMSSAKFLHKRTGYLAATLSFQQDTDVLMLTTNLIKKDLASPAPIDIGIALNGLSHIVTPDLARDLCPDLVSMLNHSRPYIRKKVVLVLYKVFLKYPEALRLSFPRLKEKLEDPDPSVVSAVISVVCELARKNPKNYLSLAPQLFKLLTTSSNNWMLIKIIKLFASLTPLEPRLIKKLLPPLTSLIQTTPAMSLLYECIYTVITGGFLEAAGESGNALAATCTNKLRKFLEDPDQNLKYVGLLAMSKLLVTHPKLVAEHKDLILECIDDEDISIRLRSLDLVVGMVHRKNIVEIVKRLITHIMPKSNTSTEVSLHDPSTIFDPVYRTDIINRIIFICSQNHYHHINDFEWYITVLVGITYAAGVNVGDVLTNQLMDVSVRVKSVREFSVNQMYNLLQDKQFLDTAKKRDSNIEVLSAAAWICGEYCNYLQDIPSTLECLLTSQVTKLPVKVQTIYVHSVIKIYAYWTSELTSEWNPELGREFVKVTNVMYEKMDMFTQSKDLEVQERAHDVKSLFKIILDSVNNPTLDANEVPLVLEGLPDLFFIYELNPVAPKAQSKVPIPEGLDLDAWINDPLPDLVQDLDSEASAGESSISKYEKVSKSGRKKKSKSKSYSSEDDEDKEQRRSDRREARKNDPFYIMADKKKQILDFDDDVDSIPVVELDINEINLQASKLRKDAKKLKRTKKEIKVPVYAEEEMPENAAESEDENVKTKKKGSVYTKKSTRDIFESNEEAGLNNVDLSIPLGKDEKFQQVKAYLSPEEVRINEEARYRTERKEQRALQKKNKELLEAKKSNLLKGKNVPETSIPEKKKKKKSHSKKSKKTKDIHVTEEEELAKSDFTTIADDVRDALAEKSEENKSRKTVEIFSDNQVSLICDLSLDVVNSPVIVIHFFVQNKDEEMMIPSLHMEFAQSFDLKLIENDDERTNMASATETFELQANEKVECLARFEALGNIRQGLCLRGDLFYDVEGSSSINQHPIEIPIPASLFLNDKEPMDPAEFSTLLAEHGDDFEYHGNVSLEVTLSSDASIEEALINALETVTRTSGLLVVEVVPGAASLYGKSVNGVQVAGLLKYTLSMDTEPKVATLSIDLKSTDDDLLGGLIHELSTINLAN